MRHALVVRAIGLALAAVTAGAAEPAPPLVPAAAEDAPKEAYEVRIQVYRLFGDIAGETSLTDYIWGSMDKTSTGATQGRITFFTLANLKIGDVQFKADESGWTWDGLTTVPVGRKVEMIAAPRVMVGADAPFTLMVGTDQPIEYFVRTSGELFQLKKSYEETGLKITGSVRKGAEGRVALSDLKIALRSIGKRAPIEGVALDVGAPIIQAQDYAISVAVQPDRAYGMLVRTEGYGSLLVRVQAAVHTPK